MDFVDDVDLGAEGGEGGAVVEDEVEGRPLAAVPEEGEVGRVGRADKSDLGVSGELGEDRLRPGFP